MIIAVFFWGGESRVTVEQLLRLSAASPRTCCTGTPGFALLSARPCAVVPVAAIDMYC